MWLLQEKTAQRGHGRGDSVLEGPALLVMASSHIAPWLPIGVTVLWEVRGVGDCLVSSGNGKYDHGGWGKNAWRFAQCLDLEVTEDIFETILELNFDFALG